MAICRENKLSIPTRLFFAIIVVMNQPNGQANALLVMNGIHLPKSSSIAEKKKKIVGKATTTTKKGPKSFQSTK